MKEVRIKNYSSEFETALESLKSRYNQTTNSKTLEAAIVDHHKLIEENAKLRREVSRYRTDNEQIISMLKTFTQLDEKRALLIKTINDNY